MCVEWRWESSTDQKKDGKAAPPKRRRKNHHLTLRYFTRESAFDWTSFLSWIFYLSFFLGAVRPSLGPTPFKKASQENCKNMKPKSTLNFFFQTFWSGVCVCGWRGCVYGLCWVCVCGVCVCVWCVVVCVVCVGAVLHLRSFGCCFLPHTCVCCFPFLPSFGWCCLSHLLLLWVVVLSLFPRSLSGGAAGLHPPPLCGAAAFIRLLVVVLPFRSSVCH